MATQEIKRKIKDYFVEIKEDKFTKVKTIKCKHKIEWKDKELENKFMLTKNSYFNSLSMSIEYRQKEDLDSIFFGFTYSNSDGGYPGMHNIRLYLILDDDKTIELAESSGFDHASQSNKVGDNYRILYTETAQLAVSISDFIAIANAKKIEYSIRFGQGSLENIFSQNNLIIFKGFYNASFDNDFDTDLILEYCQRGDKNILTNIFGSFLNQEISKNEEEVNKIKKTKDPLIIKYNISESDLKRLKEIEEEKLELGFFSIKKEKLKSESWKILKPYNVKFMDMPILLDEIKKH